MNRKNTAQFTSGTDLSGDYKDYHEDYTNWVNAHVDKDRTATRLIRGVSYWLQFCQNEDISPENATENDVRIYIDDLVAGDYAETTITRRIASVSKFYIYLSTDPRQNLDIDNPTEDISLPKDYGIQNLSNYVRVLDREGRMDVIAPTKQEVHNLFDNAPGGRNFTKTRNELIVRLFWYSALRGDELSRVKTQNTDFDAREITVRSAKLNRKDHPELYHRRVWWENDLDYLMHRYRSLRNERDTSQYLLVGTDGEQLAPSYLSRIVKRTADNAGVQEPLVRDENGDVERYLWTAHRLRHARISYLANETDMDLNHLRMMAGHAKFETTLSYVETDWDAARSSYFDAVEN